MCKKKLSSSFDSNSGWYLPPEILAEIDPPCLKKGRIPHLSLLATQHSASVIDCVQCHCTSTIGYF